MDKFFLFQGKPSTCLIIDETDSNWMQVIKVFLVYQTEEQKEDLVVEDSTPTELMDVTETLPNESIALGAAQTLPKNSSIT